MESVFMTRNKTVDPGVILARKRAFRDMTKLIVARMTDLYSASDPSMLVWNCDSIVLSEAIRDPGLTSR
ncbi:hypothetical protein QBZ16_002878 [Prototheca wickerhamii]|uniref:Uncharacterized protein n=1 Tax=Prototheca wickerhamii TaxID=3111 RepID=A0AAD9MJ17_PROWI|nr:hypothetical protein QBZ16_002878 [Prototheca wickerhamii]